MALYKVQDLGMAKALLLLHVLKYCFCLNLTGFIFVIYQVNSKFLIFYHYVAIIVY